jgi:hypothetical protein
MSYFSHAFRKVFLATGQTLKDQSITILGQTSLVTTDEALLTTPDLPTLVLNELSKLGVAANGAYYGGYVGLFDPKTNLSLDPSTIGGTCCNIYIAGSAIFTNDKIGKFHGGYTETNKSKMINPKYVSRLYLAEACSAQNEVVHVGSTSWTAGGGLILANLSITTPGTGYTPDGVYQVAVTGGSGTGAVVEVTVAGGVPEFTAVLNPGKDYLDTDTGLGIDLATAGTDVVFDSGVVTDAAGGANCCKEFLCGETYNLRLDVKGSPALRLLDHNAYYVADYYTGCCADDAVAPTAVDSTLVMIGWADQILRSPIVNPFVQIAVQDEAGVIWYAPGTDAAFLAVVGADTWDNYVSSGHTDGACAGLIFNGAYVDTKFEDCTFQPTDFYETEPVRLYLSEVDLNGDPCAFDGICVETECEGRMPNGLGETLLRDLMLSEEYRQNFTHSDLRIREITQGTQIIAAVDRNGLYDRFYLQHNVPRNYNPTGVFDNDQYLLEFAQVAGLGTMAPFYDALQVWLEACGVCDIRESYNCTSCVPIVGFDINYIVRII